MGIYTIYRYERCVEPVKRNKDGLRWIVHRFPIKNGITLNEAMRKDFSSNKMLTESKGQIFFRGIPVRLKK